MQSAMISYARKMPPKWLLHILFWLMIYLLYFFQRIYFGETEASGRSYSWYERAWVVFFHIIPVAVTSYFICLKIIPLFFDRKHPVVATLLLLAGIILIAILQRMLTIYVLEPMLSANFGEPEPVWQIITDLGILFRHYIVGILSGCFPVVMLYLLIERQQMLRRQTEMEKQKVQAELNALKSQLNPHFLFNTLNNIYALAVQQSDKTAPAVDKLSQILDYLLYRCNDQYVPLQQEMLLLDNYLALQTLRFGKRVTVTKDYSSDQFYQIAPLLLLALVENMFKHGVEKSTGPVELKISIKAQKEIINVMVENERDAEDKITQGIGLGNLQRQLDLIYPGHYVFDISREGNKFAVHLQIQVS